MSSIRGCFDIILHGNKKQSGIAARQVRRLLYGRESSLSSGKSKYADIHYVLSNVQKIYSKISEPWRIENYVVAISVIYYLRENILGPEHYFSWFYDLLLHPRGNIRYAAVRMIEFELGPLTVYIRILNFKSYHDNDQITPEKADEILFSLFVKLNDLLDKTWKSGYNKYRYVDSLPVGPCKSIQMVIVKMEERCGENYMNQLHKKYYIYQTAN